VGVGLYVCMSVIVCVYVLQYICLWCRCVGGCLRGYTVCLCKWVYMITQTTYSSTHYITSHTLSAVTIHTIYTTTLPPITSYTHNIHTNTHTHTLTIHTPHTLHTHTQIHSHTSTHSYPYTIHAHTPHTHPSYNTHPPAHR
jgi:hypothetical protein